MLSFNLYKMGNAYVGLGSNQGDRIENCTDALREISKFALIRSRSSLFETEPVGAIFQSDFINFVIEIETGLVPYELLSKLLAIEDKLGRKRVGISGPRTIDLDLIFYDDLVISDDRLSLPHPRAHLRRFVLEPLCEIAPDLIHPILKISVRKLLNNLDDNKKVERLGDFSTIIPQ